MKILLALLLVTTSMSAWADPAGVADRVRLRGCGGHPGIRAPLQSDAALDTVARRLASGARLHDALSKNGYRAEQSFSVHVSNSAGDAALERSLSEGFCSKVMDARFHRIGTYRERADTWVVFAEPFTLPSPGDAIKVSRRALDLMNQARSRARHCGNQNFPSVAKLQLNPLLERSAAAHAQDMASRGELSHQGRDGSTPAQRVTRVGYHWRIVGENIASGPTTTEEAVAGWLTSPGHCANIMDPHFTEMGLSYAVNPRTNALIYWAQDFAAPRP